MPSLDDALELLAEQDRPVPIENLIDRVELGLRGGMRPRLALADTSDRSRARRRPLAIFAGAALTVCVVAIPTLIAVTRSQHPAATTPPVATQPAPTTSVIPTTSSPTTASPTPIAIPPPFSSAPVSFARDVVDSGATSPGTFAVSGPLVDSGLICDEGGTFENRYEDLGAGRERWDARFVCGDGSGSFTLVVESVGEWTDTPGGTWDFETAWTWSPDDATGEYVGIEGRGEGAGSCSIPADRCVESLDGVLWRIAVPVDE